MKSLYDYEAPKKTTALSINSDLLVKSAAMNIDLSATLEEALKEKLTEKEVGKWVAGNSKAIEAYNVFVEDHGVFSDEFRLF